MIDPCPGGWSVTVYGQDNVEMVKFTGLDRIMAVVTMSMTLARAGYQSVIGFEASKIEVLIRVVADGWVVFAGKEGHDLPEETHPAWVRAVRREVRKQTTEGQGHEDGSGQG